MRTTVRLPDDLLRRARKAARERNTTLTALMEEGLTRVLAAPKKKERYRLPRISSKTGGVQPGIDLVKTSELLAFLDATPPFDDGR